MCIRDRSSAVDHQHEFTVEGTAIANTLSSASGSVLAGGSNMLDNDGNAGTEEALRTGEGSGKGIGTANGAGAHGHELFFDNGGTSGLQNRSHTHNIEGVAPPFYALTFLMKL